MIVVQVPGQSELNWEGLSSLVEFQRRCSELRYWLWIGSELILMLQEIWSKMGRQFPPLLTLLPFTLDWSDMLLVCHKTSPS